jgi:hypothetical protein
VVDGLVGLLADQGIRSPDGRATVVAKGATT